MDRDDRESAMDSIVTVEHRGCTESFLPMLGAERFATNVAD